MIRKKETNLLHFLHIPVICFLVAFIIISGTDNSLKVTEYEFETQKLSDDIRVVFLSDLHSYRYGENQEELLAKIEAYAPDFVLMGGDMVDLNRPPEGFFALLPVLTSRYPCYYVLGNHEQWSDNRERIEEALSQYGVTLLQGECMEVEKGGQVINICGVNDTSIGIPAFKSQLEDISEAADDQYYTILLSHRPEEYNLYNQYGFELVLTGHAHGGQIRFPILLNGLVAPNEGFFPRYTSGTYEMNSGEMLVCRGLTPKALTIPRLYNSPELVVITIKGRSL